MLSFKLRNVLVTGGAGFIGSHLCDRLLLEPVHKLIAVDNLFLGKIENLHDAFLHKNFEFIHADITNYELLEKIIIDNDINLIYHLAVIPLEVSIEKPVWCFNQNVRMTQNILEIIRQHKKNIRLIAYSTSEVYGSANYTPMDEKHPFQPHTTYAASKVSSDLLIYSYSQTFGLDFQIIRPFNNFGSRQNEGSYASIIPITIKRILCGKKPLIYDDGKQTRDFIYVGDTVLWTVKASMCESAYGKMMNMASGKQVSVEKVILTICKEMNYSGTIEYRKKRPGDVRVHEGDMKLAQKLINFKIHVDFDTGIKKTVKWYRDNLTIG